MSAGNMALLPNWDGRKSLISKCLSCRMLRFQGRVGSLYLVFLHCGCYHQSARLIDVVRSSSCLAASLPASQSGRIAAISTPKEHATQWNKEQLSGSMTRRATASSAVRTAKTYSFTTRPFRPAASAVFRKVRPFSSTSSRAPRAGRRRTYSLCKHSSAGLRQGGPISGRHFRCSRSAFEPFIPRPLRLPSSTAAFSAASLHIPAERRMP